MEMAINKEMRKRRKKRKNMSKFTATKRPVNGNVPPDDFLQTLVNVGQRLLRDEPAIFQKNNFHDIFINISSELGPFGDDLVQRASCELEAIRCLASLESSYSWVEGKDTSNPAENSPDTESAGVFQCSADSAESVSLVSPELGQNLRDLYTKHSGKPWSNTNANYNEFRALTMRDHEFATEWVIKLLRALVTHHGPVRDKHINSWLSKAAATEFASLLTDGANVVIPPVKVSPINPIVDYGDVSTLQTVLNKLGAKLVVDGKKGPKTIQATKDEQSKLGISADGIVGPITISALNQALVSLHDGSATAGSVGPELPKSYADVYRIFGDPDSAGWENNNLAWCKLDSSLTAFPLHNGNRGFMCHKLLVSTFESVFSDIVKAGLGNKIVSWDGTFNNRNIRGSSTKSLHAFGIAIDLNADENPQGSTSGKMHPGIIAAFKAHRFFHGADFNSLPDPMHFEFYSRS